MILYGASGHGLVIADILRACGARDIRFWDDNPQKGLKGYTLTLPEPETEELVILSIGNNAIRKRINDRSNYAYGRALHPKSILSEESSTGPGTVVMAGAIMNTGAGIGKHGIVNTGAVIDHECQLGDYVHISPNATLSGLVEVGEGTWIGAGATVIQEVRIGKWAIIGAGAVVIRDVPDFAVAVGNPARIIRFQELNF